MATPLAAAAAAAAGRRPVVIIGGGAMGSAVAYALARRAAAAVAGDGGGDGAPSSVTLVERDPSYARAASALAVGGLRYQFSNPLNVQLSMHSRRLIRDSQAELGVEVRAARPSPRRRRWPARRPCS
jgi:FAD-dependent oxidoreductase domain-containing protein 1